ncbi:MAG: NAD-dependent epimerase/dehydratase family protein [Candidatus Bathyarchaeia archaeon]
MKVLVTGASGFIGGHLTERLVERGYEVIAFVRKTSDLRLLKSLDIELRYGDLGDAESLREAVPGVDCVFHLAAYYTFHGKKDLYQKLIVDATRCLMKSCLDERISRFVYTSTTEVIGPVSGSPGDEETPPNPRYVYGKAKARAEEIVREFGRSGIGYTILRPTGVYGPRCVNDVSYYFIMYVLKGGFMSRLLPGKGNNLVHFTHVDDVIQGHVLALEKEKAVNQTYIIGSDQAITYNKAYEVISRVGGRYKTPLHVPVAFAKAAVLPMELLMKVLGMENFMYHVSTISAMQEDRYYSNDKAKKELGFRPRYDFETGMEETIRWYRENGFL